MTKNQNLYAAQEEIIKRFMTSRKSDHTILCGGTALARAYLHHRISYDLDFFVDHSFNPEQWANDLGKEGIDLMNVQIESSGKFVNQLFGSVKIGQEIVKVSFIEDNYAGMFPQAAGVIGKTVCRIESVEGLYHRKLRTITGSTNSDLPTDGRQTARDLFDIFVLNQEISPIRKFVEEINRNGANFSEKALEFGFLQMPWTSLMDEFEQLEILDLKRWIDGGTQGDLMSTVKLEIAKQYRDGNYVRKQKR
jgi:Nucleotidyl transferase AbiEii toxin, Type IV TA system